MSVLAPDIKCRLEAQGGEGRWREKQKQNVHLPGDFQVFRMRVFSLQLQIQRWKHVAFSMVGFFVL